MLLVYANALRYPESMAEAQEPESEFSEVNPSHELDLVTFWSSSEHDAEMEAINLRSVLEANGIPALVVGASTIPSLEFQVQVPRARLEEADRVVREAREAGPAAAEEAASEGAI